MTFEGGQFFSKKTLKGTTTKKVFNKIDFINIRNFSTTEHFTNQVEKMSQCEKNISSTGVYKPIFENKQNSSSCEKISK